jgi:hypothetical protein
MARKFLSNRRNFGLTDLVGRTRGNGYVDRKLNRALNSWLKLEQKGLNQQADEALVGLFARLPLEPIPAGFADRLMARAGFEPVATSGVGWTANLGIRMVVSLCLALMALSLWLIPGYLPALLGLFNLATLTELAVGALVGVFHQLGFGLVIWRIFSTAGTIVSSTLSSPIYLMALFSAVLMSFGAFRLLHEIVVSERSSRYVSSI